jgi:thioredoxin-like negative regulator of GroEL
MALLGGGAPSGAKQASGAVPTITEREFEREVLQSELPVLIEFASDRFAASKQMAPEVEAFANEVRGKVKVVRIEIERAPNLARELRVQSIPTFMVFAEQRISDVAVGAIRRKKMREMVEPFLPRAEGALKALELAALMKQGVVVAVDTRDKGAFDRAHVPGAVSMPLEEIEGRLAELHMLPARPVVYCRSGDKTKDLADRLNEQGLPVAFLEGGLLAWESEGLPIERA